MSMLSRISRFSILCFVVLGWFIQIKLSLAMRDSEIQILKYEIPKPALFLRARDSETLV